MILLKSTALLLALTAVLAAPPAFAQDGGEPRPVGLADANAGKQSYLQECSGCHGERGNGAGPAADFIDPRPRDFTSGRFKLRTTASGQAPSTADVLRVMEEGIPGTAMPSFAFLPAADREKIAAYVLKLSEYLEEPEPETVALVQSPPASTAATVEKGKAVYAMLECGKCHGDSGKGDGPSAAELKDEWGHPIKPRDLTSEPFRGGQERTDIYYRLLTGMDGSPMPSYEGVVEPADLWALVDYVASLRVPVAPAPLPSDPIEAGRQVAAKYNCQGCHILDDGNGGSVGPDLRVSAQKLYSPWVSAFLAAPREYGKIYPWRIHRMPDLGLSDEEVQVMTRYLAAIGKRPPEPPPLPDPATFPAERLGEGQLTFMLRCTECHNLGSVIPIPSVKQQGPDLIRVSRRVDFRWAKDWILNPRAIDPKTKMTVPGITPEQAESVRMFVWKASMTQGPGEAAVVGRR